MKKAIQWWDIGNSCVIGRIHSIVFFEPQKTRDFLRWDLQLCGSGDSSPLTIRPSPCVNSQTFFFSPSSSAFMKNFSPKTVRPMIPGYCFWWLGRGGGLLIVYSENAVIFFPNILELKSTYPKYRGAIYRYEASIKVKSWAPQSRGVRCDYIDAFSIWNIFSFVSVLDIVSN